MAGENLSESRCDWIRATCSGGTVEPPMIPISEVEAALSCVKAAGMGRGVDEIATSSWSEVADEDVHETNEASEGNCHNC